MRRVLDRLVSIDLPLAREILVVDDGSTDGTARRAGRGGPRRPGGHGDPCRAQRRQGQRAAHGARAGARHDRRHSGRRPRARSGAARRAGAADRGRHDTGRLRLAVPRRRGRSGPWLSVAANRLLTGVTNVLYGASLTDMETCYKIMRADVARSLAPRSQPLRHRAADHGAAAARRPPRDRAAGAVRGPDTPAGQEDRLARRRPRAQRPGRGAVPIRAVSTACAG